MRRFRPVTRLGILVGSSLLAATSCAGQPPPTPQIIYVTPPPTPEIIYVTPPPTPVASATPTAAPPSVLPSLTSYVVQPGDSLSLIGQKVGVDPTDLADFNNIANWDSIQVGQILYVPGPGWTPLPTPSG